MCESTHFLHIGRNTTINWSSYKIQIQGSCLVHWFTSPTRKHHQFERQQLLYDVHSNLVHQQIIQVIVQFFKSKLVGLLLTYDPIIEFALVKIKSFSGKDATTHYLRHEFKAFISSLFGFSLLYIFSPMYAYVQLAIERITDRISFTIHASTLNSKKVIWLKFNHIPFLFQHASGCCFSFPALRSNNTPFVFQHTSRYTVLQLKKHKKIRRFQQRSFLTSKKISNFLNKYCAL